MALKIVDENDQGETLYIFRAFPSIYMALIMLIRQLVYHYIAKIGRFIACGPVWYQAGESVGWYCCCNSANSTRASLNC